MIIVAGQWTKGLFSTNYTTNEPIPINFPLQQQSAGDASQRHRYPYDLIGNGAALVIST